MTTMSEPSCGNCRFFLENPPPDPNQDSPVVGACRANPPTPVLGQWIGQPAAIVAPNAPPQIIYNVTNFGAMFPTMMETGWCGKHEPKPNPAGMN